MVLPFGTLDKTGVFTADNTAVITDMHYGDSCDDSCTDTLLEAVPDSVTRLILNGDILHSFPPTDAFSDAMSQLTSEFESVIYIEGNHERMVGGIEESLPQEVSYQSSVLVDLEGYTVCIAHGDYIDVEMDFSTCDFIVIGHLHPVTDFGSKCVLQTPFPFRTPHDVSVLVLPAFGPTGGSGEIRRDASDFIGATEEIDVIYQV